MNRGVCILCTVLVCLLSLSACGNKAQQGSVVGGLTGALVGSHLVLPTALEARCAEI